MPKLQKQVLAVGGIQLNIFSPLPDPGKAAGRVAVLFLLHGRLSKADDLEATAKNLVEKSEARRRSTSDGPGGTLGLVVVTFVRKISQADERTLKATWLTPAVYTGPEKPWCQSNQPSRKQTMEQPREGEQLSACVSTPISLVVEWRTALTDT